MKSKKIIISIIVIIIIVLIVIVVKYTVIDIRWSVSPYSETRSYLCPNTINDGRASDIEIGFYKKTFSIFLYPDVYIPPKHHSSGVLQLASSTSDIMMYQGNSSELVINGHTATLKENGNIVLDKCEQKIP